MNDLNDAVRDALARAPVTLRELARRAGVPHITLSHIQNGRRNATFNVAQAVADALDAIAADCTHGAGVIRRSLSNHPRRDV